MNFFNLAKLLLRAVGTDSRKMYHALSAASLKSALREQGLLALVDRLRAAIPNVHDQYSEGFDQVEFERYWEIKMRGLHAFQVSCILQAFDHIERKNLVVADIGDSSGNHGEYLKQLAKPNQLTKVISVNSDEIAVEKIRAKGGEAHLVRAEDLDLSSLNADIV
jgi:hypothetical protein